MYDEHVYKWVIYVIIIIIIIEKPVLDQYNTCIYIYEILTTPKNRDNSTPRDSPADILGNRTPTTPPTRAPTSTTTVSKTPKSFIFRSVWYRGNEEMMK